MEKFNNYIFRLLPDQDLYEGILEYCLSQHIQSGCIVSAVGCVKVATFRKADGLSVYSEQNNFEFTSLSGTISQDGMHLHIQLCDNNLHSIGGHLLKGTLVNTTMEIVIMKLSNYQLTREFDGETGYDELKVVKI